MRAISYNLHTFITNLDSHLLVIGLKKGFEIRVMQFEFLK